MRPRGDLLGEVAGPGLVSIVRGVFARLTSSRLVPGAHSEVDMRVEATVVSMSWIPTDSLKGALKTGMDLRLSHWDAPLPDHVSGAEQVHELCRDDKFRFANLLSVWADVEDGQVREAGLHEGSGLVMGATTVRVGKIGATFRAASLPVIRQEPVHSDGSVRFVQTVGGRTGVPLPRPVPHPPYLRWQAPLVWTTLAL